MRTPTLTLALLGWLLLVPALAIEPEPVARRVVALAPNLAELVFEAGAGDSLVGVVMHSDYPRPVRALPVVGDAFRVDFERLAQLSPDLVLAWGGGNPEHLVARVRELGYRVEVLTPRRLEDIAQHLELIGEWTGGGQSAALAADRFRRELQALRRRYQGVAPLRVFYQVSVQPLYTVNAHQFTGQLIELCGGVNIFGDLPELAPVVSPEAVMAADPEVILTGSEQLPGVQATWQRWPAISAVANGQVHGVDASLVARATPRLLQGARQLCAALDEARGTAPGTGSR